MLMKMQRSSNDLKDCQFATLERTSQDRDEEDDEVDKGWQRQIEEIQAPDRKSRNIWRKFLDLNEAMSLNLQLVLMTNQPWEKDER
jgi:hypothetical protein